MSTELRALPIEPDVKVETLLQPHPARRRAELRPVDRAKLAAALRHAIAGDVWDDPGSLGLHAQDASNYFYVPLVVVAPRTRADVIEAVRICKQFDAPITCRAGGTALAGQTCNEAVVFDFSRYMNHILEVDIQGRRARVEPGLICDHLIEVIAPHRLTFGPKPSTHDRCCFGGMVANNCGGMEAQISGTAVENVEALEVLLYDGTVLELGWMTAEEFERAGERPGREGALYRGLRRMQQATATLVRERFVNIPRRISGYNLDRLQPDRDGRINVARALVGTEGTCAIMLSIEVKLDEVPPHLTVVGIGFRNIYEAADAVPKALEFQPLVCEGLDQRLLDSIRHKRGPYTRYLPLLPEGHGWLVVKIGAQQQDELERKADALCQALQAEPYNAVSARVYDDPLEQAELWKVRESGLGSTAFVAGQPDTWPGWEDSAVAPDQLGSYLREVSALFDKYGYRPALYGHFGQGLLHCRVDFDLVSAAGIEHWKEFLVDAAKLCTQKYRGSLSGEHGDGQARGWLLSIMFGSELVQAFREFKALWDPDLRMNPGKIVDADPVDAHMRLGPGYDPAQPKTHFQYPHDDGSFARATLRCVGVGRCRRTAANGEAPEDTMCPSYMVTHDERHTTRGRAHLLWEMMRGGDSPIVGGFRDEHVKESLDLCLSCKGCKRDCPVNVDMATYKSEFLSGYWAGRLRPRHAYAFGLIDKWARLATLAPGLANLLTHARPTAGLAKWIAGMANERQAPRFAEETFVSWFARRGPGHRSAQRVVLWPDTFNNHFHPHIARAAVEVLEACDFEVIVPSMPICCGRPLYDYGFLDLARQYLERVLRELEPWITAGLPIVVLEPSCAAVFRDELPNLMPGRVAAQRLETQTKLLSEFLVEHDAELPKLHGHALVQGHCHHKAALGFDAEQAVFERMQLDARLLSSGCCGMAGSFGFERDPAKQQVSHACGERVLMPAVRQASTETFILADGFSCRTQIAAGTQRRALHLAELLQLALHGHSSAGGALAWLDAGREREPERRAAAGLACLGAGALIAGLSLRTLSRRH